MSLLQSSIPPGFRDPVHDAQSTFRAVMRALSEPARPVPFEPSVAACGDLLPATCAIVMALADYDTPIWLDPALRAHMAVHEFIKFRTGAPAAVEPGEAALALVTSVDQMPALSDFMAGTAEFPDRSTTIILQVEQMSADGPFYMGPGLEAPVQLSFHPHPANFEQAWVQNHASFPLGVDLLLISPTAIAGMPRSLARVGA